MNLTSELDHDLKALRMPYIREHYQDVAKDAIAKGRGHVDFLHSLIQGERQQRLLRATKRRVQQAAFPFLRTLQAYDKLLTDDTTLILPADSSLLKYLNQIKPFPGAESGRGRPAPCVR